MERPKTLATLVIVALAVTGAAWWRFQQPVTMQPVCLYVPVQPPRVSTTECVSITITDTTTPPPVPPSPPNPPPVDSTMWIQESFNYPNREAMFASPLYSTGAGENVDTARIQLDTLVGAPVGGHSMRYDQLNRVASARQCYDYTIGRNLKFPSTVPEIWAEVWAMFTPGFLLKDSVCYPGVPVCQPGQVGNGCNPDGRISSAGYKFIFGRIQPSAGRFGPILGYGGGPSGLTLDTPNGTLVGSVGPSSIYTAGGWHRTRLHFRCGVGGFAGMEVEGFTKTTTASYTCAGFYGLALGRNLNQGPLRAQSVWWGQTTIWKTDPGWGW